VTQSLFVLISIVGLLAALGTVLSRNLVHAALYLVAFFFTVACQFIMLEAEFLAAIQVLVYIGAVAILLMFGIMLTRNVQGDDTTIVPKAAKVVGGLIALGVFVVIVFGINNHVGQAGRSAWTSNLSRPPVMEGGGQSSSPRAAAIANMGKAVGDEMLTRFAVPFEVAGLLLTAALVGAIALAHRDGDQGSPRLGAMVTKAHGSTDGPTNGYATPTPTTSPAVSSPTS